MSTPSSTSGLTSSGERTPATSIENESGSECNVDEHLTSYDRELRELRQSQDPEELDIAAADERRRERDESEVETDAESTVGTPTLSWQYTRREDGGSRDPFSADARSMNA